MRGGQIESAQMPASDEIRDIAGGDPQYIVDDSHEKASGIWEILDPISRDDGFRATLVIRS